MNWTALQGDCRDLPLPDESVEAVVTDPPYGLSFMSKAWDHDVPGPEYWTEVKRVMKPGAHLLAFGGTRTFHWLTVAIEEAGFEVRDCLSWMYGTGFPKSHDISKAIDEKAGAEREVVGVDEYRAARIPNGRNTENTGDWNYGTDERQGDDFKITAPATEQAKRWDGWGTALKPGWEPIVLAMKPTDGTFAENALEHGVAGLNIDGCRIGTADTRRPNGPGNVTAWNAAEDGSLSKEGVSGTETDGRWPANVTLSHTRFCIEPDDEEGDWDCPPSCPVRQLDEQSGISESNIREPTGNPTYTGSDEDSPAMQSSKTRDTTVRGHNDSGGASRFYYCAKASRSEREAGLPDVEGRANQHPTVKPIDLCRWLVRLVTRPDHTVLDPFMGSGSIGCAAVQERREYIGLDLEREYVQIARQRIEHWTPKQRDMFID